MQNVSSHHGFTLLELLLVIGILAILGTVGAVYYRGALKDIEIVSMSKQLIADARTARSSAMAGEGSRAWGIHLVNGTKNYYEVYSTPTTYSDPAMATTSTIYLSGGVTFSDPAAGATKDILFSRIAATTTATTTSLTSQAETITVTITSLGLVY